MAKKKKSTGSLLKNIMKSISKGVEGIGKYLSKNPVTVSVKTKKHGDAGFTVGGKLDKEMKKFLKSGKKVQINRD